MSANVNTLIQKKTPPHLHVKSHDASSRQCESPSWSINTQSALHARCSVVSTGDNRGYFCRSLLVLNLLKLELIVYLKGVRSLLYNNHYEISQCDVAQIHKHTHAHNCKFTYGLPDVISFLCSWFLTDAAIKVKKKKLGNKLICSLIRIWLEDHCLSIRYEATASSWRA